MISRSWVSLIMCTGGACQSAITVAKGYFASKSVKSFALEHRISSICRASTSALALSASIFDASGCCFSSSSIRLLNAASSRRRRSISALFLTGPTGFQNPLRPHDASPRFGHAFVNLICGDKWKPFWRGYDQPTSCSENPNCTSTLNPNQ